MISPPDEVANRARIASLQNEFINTSSQRAP